MAKEKNPIREVEYSLEDSIELSFNGDTAVIKFEDDAVKDAFEEWWRNKGAAIFSEHFVVKYGRNM